MDKKKALVYSALTLLAILTPTFAYAAPFEQPGDKIVGKDNTTKFLKYNEWGVKLYQLETSPDRILVNNDYKDYKITDDPNFLKLETANSGSLIFDKTSCSYDLYNPGYIDGQPAPKLKNISWTVKGKEADSQTWSLVNQVNNAACSVTINTTDKTVEIIGSKSASVGTFQIKLFYSPGTGIKETMRAYNNNPLWINHNIGFTQKAEVQRIIVIGKQTYDLADYNGTTLNRNFLQNKLLKLSDKFFYDFGLGFENLNDLKISWDGTKASISINYLYPSQIVSYQQWFEVDPTITVNAGGFCDTVRAGSDYRIGPKITATSALLNLYIDDVTFKLKKTGSPTGTGYGRVYSSSNTLMHTFGSIDVSTISTSETDYTFSTGYYQLQSGDYLVFESNNGDGSNNICMNTNSPSAYDGANTHTSRYNGAWSDVTDQDVRMILTYSLTPPSAGPYAVTDLTATTTGKTSVLLEFSEPNLQGNTLIGYRANYTTPQSNNPTTIFVNSTTSTSISVTGLVACTPYSFEIGIQGSSGFNSSGNVANATTNCYTAPSTPTLSATAHSDTAVRFTSVNGTTGDFNIAWYSLRCVENSLGPWVTIVSNSSVPSPRVYVYSGLTISDSVTCQWRDGSAAGWGAYSNNASGTPVLDIIESQRPANADRLTRLAAWFDSLGGVYMGMSLFPFLVMMIGLLARPKTTHIFVIITVSFMGILHGSGYYQYPDWYWALSLLFGIVIVLARVPR